MLIKDLYDKQIIGVRACRVCLSNGLLTVQDAQNYYEDHRTFKNLKQCGTHANEELKAMLRTYAVPEEAVDAPYINQLMLALTKNQRAFLDELIAGDTTTLSRVSETALTYYVDYDMSIDNLARRFFLPKKFDLTAIVRSQKKQDEIKNFLEKIKSYLLKVEGASDIQLVIWRDGMGLRKAADTPKLLKPKRSKAAYIERHATKDLKVQSVFENVAYALDHHLLFSPSISDICVKGLKLYHNDEPVDLHALASAHKLSTDILNSRLRRAIEPLFGKLKGLRNPSEDFKEYGIDLNSNHLEVTDAVVKTINERHQLNFSKEFITYIIYVFLSHRFQLLGNPQDVFRYMMLKSSRSYRWRCFYLVRKSIVDAVDWDALNLDMQHRLEADVEADYVLEIDAYLTGFSTETNKDLLRDCADFCETVLKEEFALKPRQGALLFTRNTYKKKHEYIIEALEAIGKPSHIKTLYGWIEEQYPGIFKTAENLRPYMHGDERLILAGGGSTYALKEWEQTKPDVKGGTIRQLVSGLLEMSDAPLHIQAILDHISNYRTQTSERNVLTNLKLMTPNQEFVFYPSKFVGLKCKEHLYERKKYESIPSSLLIKIRSLIQRGVIKSEKAMITHLASAYNLTAVECEAIFRNGGVGFWR